MENTVELNNLAPAQAGDADAIARLTDPCGGELLVHCYRILGSLQDAGDLLHAGCGPGDACTPLSPIYLAAFI